MRPTRVAPKRVKSVISGPGKAKVVAKVRRTKEQAYGDRSSWMEVRAKVLKRDGYKCTKCPATEYLQVDHIRSVAMGGQTVMQNLRTLCADCHAAQHSSRHSKHLILSKKRKDESKNATRR
jgi:5-methylcytosine-specific restriction endonuclease McrA